MAVREDIDEKLEIGHNEYPSNNSSNVEAALAPPIEIDEGFDPEFVKRTIRKIDWRLIPVLIAMYCVSLIDRTNLSYARQANNGYMNKELALAGENNRYSIITAIFFVPYIILELPCEFGSPREGTYLIATNPSAQFGLRKFGARYWLGGAVILWGVAQLGMAFVKTWEQLAAVRAVLGAFESALFPGASYLVACWYRELGMVLPLG
jgi:MFS family permease